MREKQVNYDPSMVDYGYIEYYRKAWECLIDHEDKSVLHVNILTDEATRDYFTRSLRQINHLIQIGKPNFELNEPRWEMYKISISFQPQCEFRVST